MVFMNAGVRRGQSSDEQGAIAILTALLMVVLFVSAAIVVDLGLARDVRRQSQNAGDAAALAGAAALYPAAIPASSSPQCQPPALGAPPCITDAVAAAKLYALDNFAVSASDWGSCTAALPSGYVSSAGTSCISYYPATRPTKVRVVIPTRTVPTFFGRMAGRSSIPVGSSALALVVPAVRCSLCFLGPVDAGNGDLSVDGGAIAVNGNVTVGPNSVWDAQSNGVVGTVSGGNSLNFTPPITSIPAFGDPLATSLTLPLSTAGLTAKTDPCGTGLTHGPGLYSGSFTSLPADPCVLQPGLYVISGLWGMKNNDLLTGTGVTLYVQSPGELDFKNGNAIFSAATTGVGAGYAIIYDRNNTKPLGLQGNGTTLITGSVYAPVSKLDFNGNSCFGFSGGPFVLGSAYTNGNTSCVTVTNARSIEVSAKELQLNE